MRKPIDPTAHVAIDYGFMAILLGAPKVSGLRGRAATLSYLFGGMISGVNLLTRNRLGVAPIISIKTHGQLETPYVPMLLALPAVTGALRDPKARSFFLAFFGMALSNYLLTDYDAEEAGRAAPTQPALLEELDALVH